MAYLAPGADPTTKCALETAKKNLGASCVRYLLMDELARGMHRLMKDTPDMIPRESDLGTAAYDAAMRADRSHVNAAEPLSDALQARYNRYVNDKALMAKLRSLVPMSMELYEHAKQGYQAQWERPLGTC